MQKKKEQMFFFLEKILYIQKIFKKSMMWDEEFDELELYFDYAMVDQAEQEYSHKQIYLKYSIRIISFN